MALPTRYPKVVFPSRVDEIAKETPDRPWFSVPIDNNDLSKGWKDITFAQGARAVNRLVENLEPRLGHGDGRSVIACVTACIDPGPILHSLALLKLGHVALWCAPRNTQEMHFHLFDKTNAKALLHTKEIPPKVILGDRDMKVFQLPTLAELLDDNSPEPPSYPYTKTYEEVKDLPVAVMHTSGSTGMPKPRYTTTGWCNIGARQAYVPDVNGIPTFPSKVIRRVRAYVGVPPWHSAGLLMGGFSATIIGEMVYVCGPPNQPPFGDTAREVLKYAGVKITYANPIIVMDLAKAEEDLKLLGTQDWISYGGGTIDKASGDAVSKVTQLVTFIASTEAYCAGLQLFQAPEDRHLWDYFHFSPEHKGVEFREVSPGQFEQVIVRCPENEMNAIFEMFPDIDEYRTSDLMTRHPDPKKSNFYKFLGRTDDLIAFANAAKFSPLAYEEQVMGNKLVRCAIMVGIQRPCAALLIEMVDPETPSKEALESIWPAVEEANAAAPLHARVRKELVIIANKAKPFERASKETVIRFRTLIKYKDEIDTVYDKYGENWQTRNHEKL